MIMILYFYIIAEDKITRKYSTVLLDHTVNED